MCTLLQRRSAPPLLILLWATLLFQVIVTAVYGEDDIDIAIQEVFNPSPSTGKPQQNIGGCTCVPYYLCNNQTNQINTDGTGLIDIRFKDGPCSNYLDICCEEPINPAETTTLSYKKDKRINCGHWNAGGVGFRITGNYNNEAQFGEFPWMVAILKSNTYLCGGSLIHPQVVLTAVHCVQDKTPYDLTVRAGEWDSQTENELFPHQDGEVTKIVKHEKYYGGALFNDVALLFLTQPFKLMDNVGTLCLPPQGLKFDRERCFASGWGKNVFGKTGVYQVILKKIDLPIVPRQECLNLLRKTRLGSKYILHESFICAGGEIGKDTCKGDGGSPLMCPTRKNPEQFQQAGIVAWGIGCGDSTPGVYVDVSQFRNWIDRHVIDHGLDTSYYDADYYGPPS